MMMQVTTGGLNPGALCAKNFKTGYIAKHPNRPAKEQIYTFRAPYFLRRPPKNLAWMKELMKPNVPNVKPILKGSSPSPPYSNGVEYMSGKSTKWDMSNPARKKWFPSVLSIGGVKTA